MNARQREQHAFRTRRGLCTALLMSGLSATACAVPARQKPRPASAPAADDAPDVVTYGRRDDLMRYAEELAARRGLDTIWVQETLAAARFVPSVAKFIMPPPAGTAKNWKAYRARFVEPVRIRAGVAFWQANAAWLERAELIYGVPAAVIVGVIGVETIYGRQTGTYRVIDALATLSFDFPAGRKDRSAYFRTELEEFFVLVHSERLDPLALKGSYAGAMGLPQFMPSSCNRYAVDFDGDGRIDLQSDPADAIGSVANYLAEAGWLRDRPTHFTVAAPVDASDRAALLAPDILPSFTAEEFQARGASLSPAALAYDGKLALVELQNGDAAPSYVAGTQNFYAVTRYNWSSYYAMAVIELGAAVAGARTATAARAGPTQR